MHLRVCMVFRLYALNVLYKISTGYFEVLSLQTGVYTELSFISMSYLGLLSVDKELLHRTAQITQGFTQI